MRFTARASALAPHLTRIDFMNFRRISAFATLFLCVTFGAAQADVTNLPDAAQSALQKNDFSAARDALAPLIDADENADALYHYALLLMNGQGGAVDRDGGYSLLDRAARLGQPKAATLLARVYMTGPSAGVDRNTTRAAELLEIAVSGSDPEAQFYLANLLMTGDGVVPNPTRGLELMEASAENGFVAAQYELSKIFSKGDESPEDRAKALKWLTSAAEGGHPEGQFFLANALYNGLGVPVDKPEAMRWYRRAAEQGIPIAQRILGTAYMTGADSLDANPQEALRWLTSAAQAGDPGAMFNLASAYGGDFGIQRNDEQAVTWLKEASDAGLARASFALAQYIEAGRGTLADIKIAAATYRTAYDQGDVRGALRLGQLTGDGALEGLVPPHFSVPWTVLAVQDGDEDARAWLIDQANDGLRPAQAAYGALLVEEGNAAEAAPFLLKAAEKGAPQAQQALGVLYTKGDGVDLDYVQAYKWLNLAAASGVEEAAETRNLISSLMTAEQLTEAQSLTRTFLDEAKAPDTTQVGEN
ncbi:MAG: hypothetical protein AAGL23_01180 [Pseudomonadota bacterium]